jgi:hypothetical protein
MPPRRRSQQEEIPGQGGLFGVDETIVGNGLPDAGAYEARKLGTITLGETFPAEEVANEPAVATMDAPEVVAAIASAVATENRSRAQRGQHSPLQRDGTYLTVRVGDVLPHGFGPVTHRNLAQAREVAQQLEKRRLSPRANR